MSKLWPPRCRNLTQAQNARLAPPLPVPHSPVRLSNRPRLNALLYVAEQGGKGCGCPARWGPTPSPNPADPQVEGRRRARVCAPRHRERTGRLKPEAGKQMRHTIRGGGRRFVPTLESRSPCSEASLRPWFYGHTPAGKSTARVMEDRSAEALPARHGPWSRPWNTPPLSQLPLGQGLQIFGPVFVRTQGQYFNVRDNMGIAELPDWQPIDRLIKHIA